jgi:hypothetical protein
MIVMMVITIIIIIIITYIRVLNIYRRTHGNVVVKALGYKPEGCGCETR